MSHQKLWEKFLPEHKREKGEIIIFFLRRHWFVLFTKYLFLLILCAAPVIVYFLLEATFPTALSNTSSKAILLLITSTYYVYLWISAFTIFLDYYLDVWLVTNHRIIDVEQKNLFNQVVSEQSLAMVQDVSSSLEGVFPTFLEYGDVIIQSAAAKSLFHFRDVAEPHVIARRITELATDYRESHPEQS